MYVCMYVCICSDTSSTCLSCSMRVRISQVGKDRHVARMLTLIVAHQTPKQEPVPELDRREQPFER